MWNLIKKDFMLCRLQIFLIIVFSLFLGPFSFIFLMMPTIVDPKSIYSIFFLSFYLYIAYLLTLGTSIEKHDKVNGDMIVYSLPIERTTIIEAKYMAPLIYLLIHAFFHYLLSLLLASNILGGINFSGPNGEADPINIFSMIAALAIVLFILSISLYFTYFKDDNQNKRSGIVSIATFILIVASQYLIHNLSQITLGMSSIGDIVRNNREIIILMIFGLSLLSYFFSMNKLKKKLID